ncbi:MAG TPA: 30S ribosomal protein S12 methylthiotransferase RimO [Anaerolineae bacterium]|nr:30S ribosomal protein S12 methylthiotransferase RimO [Anaerolineae bacterium]
MKRSFYVLSLGCPKNTVDSEAMSALLEAAGLRQAEEPQDADVLIVNTCGFIDQAREESYAALREMAQEKRSGQILLAAGCLSQRYGEQVRHAVPGVDGILGTREWANVVSCIDQLLEGRFGGHVRPKGEVSVVTPMQRQTQGPSAYLKIADGCSAPCAFCAIPLIKGPQRSKARPAILEEARQLVAQGVQEIILIAQDTTAYGRDLGERDGLPGLIKEILDTVPQIPWLRLMYAYSQHITPLLIETMASHQQICHYLDLPLQHAHPATLRRMRRSSDVESVRRLISDLREAMPDIALRTAFIVGYPGETEEEFATLLQFMEETAFDKVGVFIYSPEEGTAAMSLPNPVPREVAEERYARAMEVQQGISLQRNQTQVSRTLNVLIEGAEQGISVGRSYRDAPEIDGYVLVPGEWPVGRIVQVRIERATEYDLEGRVPSGVRSTGDVPDAGV